MLSWLYHETTSMGRQPLPTIVYSLLAGVFSGLGAVNLELLKLKPGLQCPEQVLCNYTTDISTTYFPVQSWKQEIRFSSATKGTRYVSIQKRNFQTRIPSSPGWALFTVLHQAAKLRRERSSSTSFSGYFLWEGLDMLVVVNPISTRLLPHALYRSANSWVDLLHLLCFSICKILCSWQIFVLLYKLLVISFSTEWHLLIFFLHFIQKREELFLLMPIIL